MLSLFSSQIFDILWVEDASLDGARAAGGAAAGGVATARNLLGYSLRDRRDLLRRVLVQRDNYIEVVEGQVVSADLSRADRDKLVDEALNRAVDNQEEGLVLKNLETPYVLGEEGRKRGHWVKLKPEYEAGMTETLDLIILAGYYGEGKLRNSMVSQFLMGVADNDHVDDDGNPTRFFAFVKVGTGYSLSELQNLNERLEKAKHPYDKTKTLPHLNSWKPMKSDDVPDFWYEPRHSHLMQVKAAEVVDTDQFNALLTLRFPRVENIRFDKDWNECLTYIDLKKLMEEEAGGINRQDRGGKKRKGGGKKRKHGRQAGIVLHGAVRQCDVEQTTSILSALEVYVLPGASQDQAHTKASLETRLLAHGGKVVSNPLEKSTDLVVAPASSGIQFKNLSQAGKYDIVGPAWVAACEEQGRSLWPVPAQYLVHSTEKTRERLKDVVDEFGCAFADDIDQQGLKELFERMDRDTKRARPPVTPDDAEICERLLA